MEIQQHDAVVVEVAGIPAGLRQAQAGGRGVAGEEGGARGCGAAALPPPLFIGVLGGAGPLEIPSEGGAAARGGTCPPSQVGPPTPRVSNPRRRGGPWGAHQPTRGWFPSHFSPWGPPG